MPPCTVCVVLHCMAQDYTPRGIAPGRLCGAALCMPCCTALSVRCRTARVSYVAQYVCAVPHRTSFAVPCGTAQRTLCCSDVCCNVLCVLRITAMCMLCSTARRMLCWSTLCALCRILRVCCAAMHCVCSVVPQRTVLHVALQSATMLRYTPCAVLPCAAWNPEFRCSARCRLCSTTLHHAMQHGTRRDAPHCTRVPCCTALCVLCFTALCVLC